MAKAGRKRKPTQLRLVEGNAGHRPIPESPKAPERDLPDPPRFLHKFAREEWKRIANDLYDMGVLSFIDRAGFAGYCQAYARWRQAEEAIMAVQKANKSDPTFSLLAKTTGGNVIQHPLVSTANAAMRDMARLAAEFGLTPSGRAGLESKRGQSEDPLLHKYGIR
jgi:P27 family predicted phage terminase small subunit